LIISLQLNSNMCEVHFCHPYLRMFNDLSGLRRLQFDDEFSEYLGSLPAKLQIPEFGDHYSWNIVPGLLPDQLQELIFSKQYFVPIEAGASPQKLEEAVSC
jgi:hypothetical protein